MQRTRWMRGAVLIVVLALVSAACGSSDDSEACDNAQEVTAQPEAAAESWAVYYSVLNDRDIVTEGIYYRFPYECDTWTFNSDRDTPTRSAGPPSTSQCAISTMSSTRPSQGDSTMSGASGILR